IAATTIARRDTEADRARHVVTLHGKVFLLAGMESAVFDLDLLNTQQDATRFEEIQLNHQARDGLLAGDLQITFILDLAFLPHGADLHKMNVRRAPRLFRTDCGPGKGGDPRGGQDESSCQHAPDWISVALKARAAALRRKVQL